MRQMLNSMMGFAFRVPVESLSRSLPIPRVEWISSMTATSSARWPRLNLGTVDGRH